MMSTGRAIPVDLALPAEYVVTIPDELPGRPAAMHEFARMGRVVDGGILIDVKSTTGNRWCGLVANGHESVQAAQCGVYSTPTPSRLCVVARGDAYLIDAEMPERWEVLKECPVVAVRPAVEKNLLILATPRRVLGLGSGGVKWLTPRIAIDGIALGAVLEGRIEGVADPCGMEPRNFTVDLRTGKRHGGYIFPEPA